MWNIVGICRVTFMLVEVAIASNETERRAILREEARNYFDLRAVRMRLSAA